MNREALGERIASFRTGMGWSQSELARLMAKAGAENYTQMTVSRIEKGESPLSILDGCLMADVFGVTLDQLVGRAPAPVLDGSAGLVEAIRILSAEIERRKNGAS